MNGRAGSGGFVLDPRKLPRVPVRCRVDLLSGPKRWRGETLDVGPGGCQVVSPAAVGAGSQLGIVVTPAPDGNALHLMGRVAWASAVPPVRLGVAFLPGTRAASWFEMLVRAQPHLVRLGRAPDRIPLDAMLYPAAPPGEILDFTPNELLVLRNLGDGVTAEQLRERLGSGWSASRTALFGLLARKMVTLSASEAVPASRWRRLLFDAELAEAVEAVPAEAAQPERSLTPRPSASARPPKAQRHLEMALVALASGHLPDAIAHVRIAASLAPGDELIGQVLGRLAP